MADIIIIVISSRPALEDFKTRAATKFRVAGRRGGAEIFDNAGDRILITGPSEKPRKKYEKKDLLDTILASVPTPHYYYYFRYESKRLMKELAPVVFEGEEMLVDIGFGVLLASAEFCNFMENVPVRNETIKNEGGASFYCLSKGPTNEVRLSMINRQYDWWELFKGDWRPANKVEVKIRAGKKFNDILYYYEDPVNFAISERLRQILIEEGITGWDTYDLSIADCDRPYYGFVVKGKCTAIRQFAEKGEQIGYAINAWDGSDFFSSEGSGQLFFTQKVKDLFNKHDVSKPKIIDSRDVIWH